MSFNDSDELPDLALSAAGAAILERDEFRFEHILS